MSETMNLYQALLSAQKAFDPVVKNSVNPAFKSRYADLGSVIDAITPALHANGLLVVQRLDYVPDALVPLLHTAVIHAATGDQVTSTVPIVCKDPTNPQAIGGAITYLRRYSLLALLNIVSEDDDGNAASQPAQGFPTGSGARTAAARSSASTTNAVAKPTATPPAAPQRTERPRPAPRTDGDLLAIAGDPDALRDRRVHAAKVYLSRADNPFDVEARAQHLRGKLDIALVTELRDLWLATLAERKDAPASAAQPAGVAG